MAWPVGVDLRECSFSSGIDAESNGALSARAVVACSELLIHIPTGVPLLPTPEIFTNSFFIPVTDQEGLVWGDGYGNYFVGGDGNHTHSYYVEIEYEVNGVWIKGRTIPKLLVDTSVSVLDLDLTVDFERTVYDNV
jgi:hypothetical protein